MRRALPLACALLTIAAAARAASWPAPAGVPGVERITADALMKSVRTLASAPYGGRLAGSAGYLRAVAFAEQRFRKAGLTPAGADGWRQPLAIEYADIDRCELAIAGGHDVLPLRLGVDFTCRGLTGSGSLTGDVVFVGYGLSRPERGYDDYAGVDVTDRVVLAFKEPPPFTVDSTGWGDATLPRPRARVAAAHGARALLLVSRPAQPEPQPPIGSMLEGPGPQDERFPSLQVSVAVAESLAAGGPSLAATQVRIDSLHAPASRALASRVRIGVKAAYRPDQPTANVLAMLPGSDPGHANEVIVVGAHLDHVGTQGGTLMFPGANDNASGASAVIAIAEAFARAPQRPKRTLVFALFSSEEAGLLGARHFVEHPPVERGRIVAYLNLDCIGHGDSIQVGGGRSWGAFWNLARDLDARGAARMVEATWPGGGADAEPFQKAGIPNLYFASRPSYTWLHQPGDTPETLRPELLEAIARLAYATAWTVAESGVPKE